MPGYEAGKDDDDEDNDNDWKSDGDGDDNISKKVWLSITKGPIEPVPYY